MAKSYTDMLLMLKKLTYHHQFFTLTYNLPLPLVNYVKII